MRAQHALQVSLALAEKLDVQAFTASQAALRAAICALEGRLKDRRPLPMGAKSSLDLSSPASSNCLCCDSKVRSVKDMQVRPVCSRWSVDSPAPGTGV